MREAEFEKLFQGEQPAAGLDVAWDKYFATEGPFQAWAALKARTDWMIGRVQGPCVLDVGCGSGLLSYLAFGVAGVTTVFAVDPDERACAITKERAGVHVSVLQRWAEDLQLLDGGFDTVLLGETLQHALNPCEALREARRVLTMAGHLVVSAPEGGKPKREHLRRFTRDQLIALVELAGFRVDEFKRIWPWVCLVAHKVEEPEGG